MRRTIHDLIEAAFAGDPITQAEDVRIARYFRQSDRLQRLFRTSPLFQRLFPGAGEKMAGTSTIAEEFEVLRDTYRRNRRRYTSADRDTIIRFLFVYAGWTLESEAQRQGLARRAARTRDAARKLSREAARAKRDALLDRFGDGPINPPGRWTTGSRRGA